MRRTFVPPSGDTQATFGIIGEQPGIDEVRGSPPRPFIGQSGRMLDDILSMCKIIRSNLYITNVIKDLDEPLAKYIDIDFKRGKFSISPNGYKYIQELGQELKSLNLNAVLAFGNVPLIALCNRIGIGKWRGSVLESELVPGLKVIPAYHPATILPPKCNYLNKPLIVEDLLRAEAESKFRGFNRLSRTIIIKPSYEESLAILNHCIKVGQLGQIIAIDIEVINKEVDCFSVGWNKQEACCIPLRYSQGDYFTPYEELEIIKLLARIIQDERISKIGANFIFDLEFLFRKYGILPAGDIHCTQIAQKISYPDFPAGLDFVTSQHTDIPYYKADGKKWMKMQAGTWDTWWNYNGMDSIVPIEANVKQLKHLELQSNIPTYNRQRKLIEPLIYMGEKGIRVDVQGMLSYQEEQSKDLESLISELKHEVGHDINPNSPQQLKEYFYSECGLKPYKSRNTGNDSTDVDALKRIFRLNGKGSLVARLMLDIRGLSKRISTYLNIGKVDPDGRYRSSYKPVGAETGRLSSGQTIFDTGGNQQNWPHDLLRFFLCDEGYILYSFDLSQIENRIVAYVGGVISQIEAFESGVDLHRLTASIIFSKPYDQISDEDGSSLLGDGRQSERYWGKKCKFSSCEVLTKNGWISIAEACKYKIQIAQWEKDSSISFVTPSSWYIDNFTGEKHIIENQRIYQEATPEHKMPIYYNGSIVDKKISEYPKSGKYSAPLSGLYNGDYILPPLLMRLIVAFQADGYWHNEGIAFKLQKQRKISRLKTILDLAGITYNDNPSGIYILPSNQVCSIIMKIIGKEKLFDSWLLSLSQEALSSFIDELPYWDGTIEDRGEGKTPQTEYFTTVKQNAEWVQTISHLCGKAANIILQDNSKTNSFGNKMLYRVSIRNSISPATSAIRRKTTHVDNEPIYCPTVPSGYFLCKEKEIISVTGNSNHATNYDVSFKTFALVNEMSETDAKQTLESVHRGYPQIRGGFHVVIQNMLRENRMVTNLFGRNRLFLGPIFTDRFTPKSACDSTFREAYAHLPQSTCADKMNEQGIEYVYYNQQWFSPVEILTQIHDSLVFQIPLSIPWIAHADILLRIKNSLETPLIWHGREIKTPVDLAIGFNMYKKQMKEMKSKVIPSSPEILSEKLQGVYNDLSKAKL